MVLQTEKVYFWRSSSEKGCANVLPQQVNVEECHTLTKIPESFTRSGGEGAHAQRPLNSEPKSGVQKGKNLTPRVG